MRTFGFGAVLAAWLLCGCDAADGVPCDPPSEAPPGSVLVQTDCAAYAPADSIIVSLRSLTSEEYTFGPCGMALERLDGERWSKIEGCSFGPSWEDAETGETFCSICLLYAVVLEPEGEGGLTRTLNDRLRAGTYRVMVDLSTRRGGERRTITSPSNEFTIRP